MVIHFQKVYFGNVLLGFWKIEHCFETWTLSVQPDTTMYIFSLDILGISIIDLNGFMEA